MKKKGFSLIELLVAIAIMATIMAFALPNYLGARERARDAKKKAELTQLKTALRMYYNDHQSYPATAACGGKPFSLSGCGASGTSCCPCSTSFDFAQGETCGMVYMKKYITTLTGMAYFSSTDGEVFCLRIALENRSDPDLSASQLRCATACSSATHPQASCPTDNYCVCPD